MFTFLCVIIIIALVVAVGTVTMVIVDPNRGTVAAFLTNLIFLVGAIIDLVRLP